MKISVKAKKAYDVYIEDEIFSLKDYLDLEKRYFVVIDSNLPKEKVELFKKELKNSSFYYLEAIEENKNLITVEVILEELLNQNFSKSDFLIGLGGGIIGDIAAFIASIYKRGMNYIYFPTSTTAMIDVAIGGKNGVNLLKSKNIVGTINPPYKVVIDLSFLNSLPEKHYNNGLVEAIKMAMLFDNDLFEVFLKKDFKNIQEIVSRSLKIKKDVVEKDEDDLDYRNLLN
ncbi:MAG TPA: iron-containing alcohol dehydrogenase, partial [Bacilli bacterium]|nr:iron-containing alcohol dehydrogenase [Bacilli bacterium]